jgi:sugar phosphate isomerase/epimerase
MKVGLDNYTIGHLKLSAMATLAFAKDHGLAGVQFGTPAQLSPKLDGGELRAVRDWARENGLYLEVGIPSINPHRASESVKALGDGAWEKGLERMMQASVEAGSPSLRTTVGGQRERYDPDVPWPRMLEDAAAVLARLAPTARDLGVKFALETHADATTFELLRVIERVGTDVAGICLDTGNLTMRLEEFLAATRRVAPHVVATHTKDSILFFGEDGLRWQARACGQGLVPFRDLFRTLAPHAPALTLSIEDHPRIYPLPIFDPAWLSSYADLTTQELAALVRLATETERRVAGGALTPPEQEETVPWETRCLPRLASAARFLKEALRSEGLYTGRN